MKMNELVNFFKVLSDETRLRILILLYHKSFYVCEMCGVLGLSQPKISKHLAKLRDMGLVKDERQEQFISYGLNLENDVFIRVLQGIINNAADYPVIKQDIERIADAGKYLAACERKRVNKE